jgi:hypothetical protein
MAASWQTRQRPEASAKPVEEAHVRLTDRPGTLAQCFGDFAVGQSLDDQIEKFAVTRPEAFPPRPPKLFDRVTGDGAVFR